MKDKILFFVSFLFICCFTMFTMSTADSDSLSIMFSGDVSYPTTISYYKFERIKLDEATVKKAIEKYRLPPGPDEKWDMEINKCNNTDCALQFKERNGAAGTISCDFVGISSHGEGEKYSRASETVRAFMDEIGLTDYEYPFYFCNDAYLVYNTSPWHPITEEDYLAENSGYQMKIRERTGGSPILVVVRFRIGEMCFATSSSWTQYSDHSGNGNPTPSGFFLISENGQICEAYIRNPVKIIQERENEVKILPWEKVYKMSQSEIESVFCKGKNCSDKLKLQNVELVMLTNEKNISFPAWYFLFECYTQENNRYFVFGLMYNAFTGEKVW